MRINLTRRTILGYGFGLLAAFCYGLTAVLVRRGVSDFTSPLVGAAISLLFGSLILTMMGLRDRQPIAPGNHRRAIFFFLISGLLSGLGVASNFFALMVAPVVVVAPVGSITPLVTLVAAYLFLRRLERVTIRVWLGAVMVVLGVILITLGRVGA